jgi:hypothetical protein
MQFPRLLFLVLLSATGFAQTGGQVNVWTPHGPEGGVVGRPPGSGSSILGADPELTPQQARLQSGRQQFTKTIGKFLSKGPQEAPRMVKKPKRAALRVR